MKYQIAIILILSILLFSCNSNDNYLDASLNAKKRTELLLEKMILDEKIGQMCQYVGEVTKNQNGNADEEVAYVLGLGEKAALIKEGKIGSFLKVPSYKEANYLQHLAEQSRLKIPLLIATDALHGHGSYKGEDAITLYPTQIGIASTFDPDLAFQIAKYTASEMRATGNHWAFSPNIEVVRDLRWGRTGETFGEDPYLVSEMGKAMIHGYQGADFHGTKYVIACAKHFVAGGIAYNGLNGAAADISERTLYEIFFPPFEEAVKNGVYTIMPAHNEINGIPCHAHKQYLTGLIRNQWRFQGIFISDWMDIGRLSSVHKIAVNEKEAAKIAVLAGLDVHMQGPGFFDYIKEKVEAGEISEERINEAARKIIYAKFQLGLFENRYIDSIQLKKTLTKQEHRDLALKSARKSIVLLTNKDKILPISKNLKRIFITGPNANNQAMLGDWSEPQPDKNIITVLEGIQNLVSNKTFIDYLPWEHYDSISNQILENAKKSALQSDLAILVLGENSLRYDPNKTSSENLDKSTLELAGTQLELLKAVQQAGKPVLVVLINGSVVASPWMVNNVNAIIESWEPGMFGGQAIAEVFFGDYNPGGRLPISIPQSVGHQQSFYNRKPSAFHRGRFYNSPRESLFDFGYGLSYTNFKYDNLKMPDKLKINSDLKISLSVENTGDMLGDEVVLIYLNDKISSVTTPVKKLVAFKRINLNVGERKQVEFVISNKKFELFDMNMKKVLEPGDFDIIVGNEILRKTVHFE